MKSDFHKLAGGKVDADFRGVSAGISNGFALIELLVVIATIGILAALLLPTLSRAKAKAERIQCCSNMKQWAHATFMYLGDNRDEIPFRLEVLPDHSLEFWFDKLSRYVADSAERTSYSWSGMPMRLLKCPSSSNARPPFYSPKMIGGWFFPDSFIGPYAGGRDPLTGLFLYRGPPETPEFRPDPLKATSIQRPGDAMMFMDCIGAGDGVSSPLSWPFNTDANGDGLADSNSYFYSDLSGPAFNYGRPTVHNIGCDVTLLDGHVEWVSFKKLWQVDAAKKVVHSFWYLDD